MAPFAITGIDIESVELVPVSRLEVISRNPPDLEPRGGDSLTLLNPTSSSANALRYQTHDRTPILK